MAKKSAKELYESDVWEMIVSITCVRTGKFFAL